MKAFRAFLVILLAGAAGILIAAGIGGLVGLISPLAGLVVAIVLCWAWLAFLGRACARADAATKPAPR